jgi:hypothetical protein
LRAAQVALLTLEVHHIVPVAWQLSWQPAIAPYPGRDPEGRGELWDARTIACCPTGHRNVHHWIVALMHALTGEEPVQAAHAVEAEHGGTQFSWAVQALSRFKGVGGSLQALIAAGEWGTA